MEYKTCIVGLLLTNICIVNISDAFLHTLFKILFCGITIKKTSWTKADVLYWPRYSYLPNISMK